jgi:hypothetical protein
MGIISKENKLCYLMGDFNLNLLNHHTHQLTAEFLDIMFGHMFFPLITLPTRITAHTATVIDNIYTNNSDNHSLNGLLLSDISDHLPVFCISKNQVTDLDHDKYLVFRDKNSNNVAKFCHCLNNINWYNFYDPLLAYDSFFNKYCETYNNCFPLKRVRKRKYALTKPWLSKVLLKSIRQKNRLYKRYLNSHSSENELSYKRYRNKLNHSLRLAKQIYYDKQFDYFKSNIIIKRSWKLTNEVINKNKVLENFHQFLI